MHYHKQKNIDFHLKGSVSPAEVKGGLILSQAEPQQQQRRSKVVETNVSFIIGFPKSCVDSPGK